MFSGSSSKKVYDPFIPGKFERDWLAEQIGALVQKRKDALSAKGPLALDDWEWEHVHPCGNLDAQCNGDGSHPDDWWCCNGLKCKDDYCVDIYDKDDAKTDQNHRN